jgi:serine/threonine-protein kinase
MYSFREDADAATRLTHDRVVATDEIARRDGHTYIVSPYTPAIPLSHHLQGGVPGPDRALALLGPLAGALDAAARTDLAHGAVHPRTIWVVSDPGGVSAPRALLSGFGLHHLLRVLAVQRRADVVDDFLYVAPELLRGGRPSTRSDQYALAAAFLHAMTGRPPFEGEHLAALFGAHLYRSPPPVELDDWMAALALDEILARSLAKNPDHRFERCHDFVDAVAQWQHQYRTASAAAGADAPDREPAPVSAAVPVGAAAAKPPSSEPAPDSAVPAPDSAVPAAIARRQPWRLLRIAPTPVLAAVGLVVGIIVALIVIPRGPSPAEPDKEVPRHRSAASRRGCAGVGVWVHRSPACMSRRREWSQPAQEASRCSIPSPVRSAPSSTAAGRRRV